MINKYLKRNRSHYLKWNLTEDLSIRYYFKYENKQFKKYENNFVLKSHLNKTYTILSEIEAESYIKDLVPEEYFSLSGDNYEYIRLKIDTNSVAEIIISEDDY